MVNYELAFLLNPNAAPDKAGELVQKISEAIKQNGGLISKEERPIKIVLRYPIKKNLTAFLCGLGFSLEPEKISTIKELLNKEEGVIRSLIIKKEFKKPRKVRLPRVKLGITTEKRETAKPKKVELEEIEKKLEEILGQ